MKIYKCPAELPVPEWGPDVSNEEYAAAIERHKKALHRLLNERGFTGRTGEIYRETVADGYAEYMFADDGAESFLVHLPYGDSYQSLNVQYVPREEILRRIDLEKNYDAIFAARKGA